jgi:hypothetical protein
MRGAKAAEILIAWQALLPAAGENMHLTGRIWAGNSKLKYCGHVTGNASSERTAIIDRVQRHLVVKRGAAQHFVFSSDSVPRRRDLHMVRHRKEQLHPIGR